MKTAATAATADAVSGPPVLFKAQSVLQAGPCQRGRSARNITHDTCTQKHELLTGRAAFSGRGCDYRPRQLRTRLLLRTPASQHVAEKSFSIFFYFFFQFWFSIQHPSCPESLGAFYFLSLYCVTDHAPLIHWGVPSFVVERRPRPPRPLEFKGVEDL